MRTRVRANLPTFNGKDNASSVMTHAVRDIHECYVNFAHVIPCGTIREGRSLPRETIPDLPRARETETSRSGSAASDTKTLRIPGRFRNGLKESVIEPRSLLSSDAR